MRYDVGIVGPALNENRIAKFMGSVIVTGQFEIQLAKCRAADEGAEQLVMARAWLMCAGENRVDYTQRGRLTDSLCGQTFAGSNELKSAMMNAGVVGRPDMWITTDVEHTAY